jgi:hypothetical protein
MAPATTTTEATSTSTIASSSTSSEMTSSTGELPANALCVEAFRRAAAVSDLQDVHADLFPVFVHCSLQGAMLVAADYPEAFDIRVDDTLLADWCFFQGDSHVSNATFPDLVGDAGGTVRETPLCEEVLGPAH